MRAPIDILSILLLTMAIGVLPAVGTELEKGKQFYEEKRCGLCHVIEGKGGKMGPDLSTIGSTRDHEWLTEFLKNPKKMIPGAKMMAVKGSERQLSALAIYFMAHK